DRAVGPRRGPENQLRGVGRVADQPVPGTRAGAGRLAEDRGRGLAAVRQARGAAQPRLGEPAARRAGGLAGWGSRAGRTGMVSRTHGGTDGRQAVSDDPLAVTVRGSVIPADELTWRFSRSPGPGGQSVNTTDSRV